ncbi:MAG: hypothetical protein IKQ61_03605, partial [Spirochaetales bacterium]|nr:hypothetical protein [Spirochaetales bacterium]
EALSYAFSTSAQKGYVHDEGYYPNLFITNHDLVRFGNLLNWEFNIGTGSGDAYWGRHRVALATLAAYTGPVTIYYGDEWGAIVEGYTGSGSLGAYNDNVARSTGKISGFNSNEQALINYTKKLLTARAENEAMWNGSNATVQSTTDFYVGKKTLSGKTIIYGINNSSSQKTFSASGTVLADNGENGSSVSGSAKVAPYSATFILVQ